MRQLQPYSFVPPAEYADAAEWLIHPQKMKQYKGKSMDALSHFSHYFALEYEARLKWLSENQEWLSFHCDYISTPGLASYAPRYFISVCDIATNQELCSWPFSKKNDLLEYLETVGATNVCWPDTLS